MTLKFKPEDFDFKEYRSSQYWDEARILVHISEIANVIFDKWLSEQKVVYIDRNETEITTSIMDESKYQCISSNFKNSFYKALLVCIEPIVKCKHEKEKVKQECWTNGSFEMYKCSCGARVEPETYRTVEQ